MDLELDMRCPGCKSAMEPGYLPTGGGMHWFRRTATATGVAFAESIPGTFSWLRRARLPAWRCKKCQFITFRYGAQIQRELGAVEQAELDAQQTAEDDAAHVEVQQASDI
ncbi:MAG: PF20097 family protein [Phycisphaeraceae bacterium]